MTLSIIFSAVGLILVCFSFLYLRSYLRRRTGAEQILADYQDEVTRLTAQIDEAADRDTSMVEDRIASLRAAIEEADRHIAVYTRELNRQRSQEAAYAALGRQAEHTKIVGNGAEAGTAVPQPVPMTSAGADSHDSPVSQFGVGETVPAEERSLPENIRPQENDRPRFIRSSNPVEPKSPSFAERVAELYRAGFSPDLIASRLGASLAAVDLAIALSDRGSPVNTPDGEGAE
jgi:hypothetical protein